MPTNLPPLPWTLDTTHSHAGDTFHEVLSADGIVVTWGCVNLAVAELLIRAADETAQPSGQQGAEHE